MKILYLYRRRWWLLYFPILLAIASLLLVTLWVWKPLPPTRVVIGTGPAQSSYLALARAYAIRLERLGIGVDIVTHPRPQDPLKRLVEGDPAIDVTFAQGLYADQSKHVQALAVIGHEIVWLVARRNIDSLVQLRGQHVAASVPGSSNHLAAEQLLKHVGIRPDEVTMVQLVGDAAIAALESGQVDAVVHVATGESQTAAALARLSGTHLLGVEGAGRLAALEPHMRAVVMPQGSIELRSNLPATDMPTMVTLTHLLIRSDLHPALQRALLDVAGELHVMSGFLETQGMYPTTVGSDFPVSPTATRYLRGDRPWMEALLPYGTAQWAELVLYVLLPLVLLGIVLLWRAPSLIEWRVDAALQHFYGELKFLEEDLTRNPPSEDLETQRSFGRKLDALERQVLAVELPDHYADRWYTLREHLQQVRERLHLP